MISDCSPEFHYSIDNDLTQTIEEGPERAACPCPHCGAKFRPRPLKECVTTPSIYDMLTIARVRRGE